jgi:putative enterotoxin / cell-wall binding protein
MMDIKISMFLAVLVATILLFLQTYNLDVYMRENVELKQQIEFNQTLIQNQKETIDKLNEMLYNENMAEKEAIANTIKDTNYNVVGRKVMEITHYTHTGSPTASGVMPTVGHTIACNFLPFGTKVRIGEQVYTVEDTGGVLGNTVIDVFVDSEEEAIQKGRYTTEVEILGE